MSECRRRAGADDLARLGADAAEAVGPAALEIIGVAGPEDAALAVNSHFQPAREHDPAFLAIVHQRDAPGVAAGLVALLQDLQAATEQIVTDLAIGDRPLADFAQLVGTVKRLARAVGFEGEEFRHPHRDAVQDALERADRRIHLVGFDQRDRRVGHARTLGEFALRYLVAGADESQTFADIDAHPRLRG